jgi:CHAD domain-containing protein
MAQEVLGEHQDAAIAAETMNDLAHAHLDDGELCLVAGRLVQANRSAVADSRRAFGPAWKAARKAVG